MGVAKSWRFSLISPNLALFQQQNSNYSNKTGGGGGKGSKHHHFHHHHSHNEWWRSSATPQRWKIPWSLVVGFILFSLGLISLFTGHVASDLEWYSQKLVRNSLGRLDGNRREPIDIWQSKNSNFFFGCSERGRNFAPAIRERSSNGYLLIAASGGLNQQRTGITDAVIVARILNATLVVPELDHHSFWKDDSDFVNIFNVDWFISYLAKDVTIVKRVPDKVMRSMEKPPYTMRVPRKSPPEYYLDQVLPILMRRRVIQLTKFDYRLANNLNEEELQKLRCRVNYHALRFAKPIEDIGQRLVIKMRSMAKRFIAVHLRFEPDMLAFSGCYYGGGEKERFELGEIRKRWETLPYLSSEEERVRGKCPFTPHEVGLMLRALEFTNDTYIYVASGEIYGGEETLGHSENCFQISTQRRCLLMKSLNLFFDTLLAWQLLTTLSVMKVMSLSPTIMETWPRCLQVEGGMQGIRGPLDQMQRGSVHCLWQGARWTGIHLLKK